MKKIVLSFVALCSIFILFSCGHQTTKKPVIIKTGIFTSKAELSTFLEKYKVRSWRSSTFINSAYGQMDSSNHQNRNHSVSIMQVQGIDEADKIKTDGTYIYFIANRQVLISKVYPVSDMNLTNTLTYEDGFLPISLYVDNNYLIVMGWEITADHLSVISRIIIYDKTNYDTPKDIIKIDGEITTRKINDELIVVSKKGISLRKEESLNLPEISINDKNYPISYENIDYHQGSNPFGFTSLLKFDLNKPMDAFYQYTFLGTPEKVYVSPEFVYLTKYEISSVYIENEAKNQGEESTTLEKFIDEKHTIVTKINYTDAHFGDSKTVTVKGDISNKYLMDEYQNTFRIATTSLDKSSTYTYSSSTNLYIYDENFELLSKIENIAENEQIYAALYMGEKIYIVTNRLNKMNTLNVINAKDPKKAVLLGNLELSGQHFPHLFPYDETHIINYGYEISTEGVVPRPIGIKMSMLDVEDPENPISLFHKEYLGDIRKERYGTILISKEKRLITVPIPIIVSEYNYKAYKVCQIDLENGFTFDKNISRFDMQEDDYKDDLIIRSIYIENNLYTITKAQIRAHSLTTYETLNTLGLGYDSN